MMMFICSKKHLNNIWSSVHEKVKQDWADWEINFAYKRADWEINFAYKKACNVIHWMADSQVKKMKATNNFKSYGCQLRWLTGSAVYSRFQIWAINEKLRYFCLM